MCINYEKTKGKLPRISRELYWEAQEVNYPENNCCCCCCCAKVIFSVKSQDLTLKGSGSETFGQVVETSAIINSGSQGTFTGPGDQISFGDVTPTFKSHNKGCGSLKGTEPGTYALRHNFVAFYADIFFCSFIGGNIALRRNV